MKMKWFIEETTTGNCLWKTNPDYFKDGLTEWTLDATKAWSFESKEEAERYIKHLGFNGVIATEHELVH